MSMMESSEGRRRRLLVETQGRRLDEAFTHDQIRADLEAESQDPDPDSIVTPEMVEQLNEYMDELEGAGIPPGVLTTEPTPTTRALFSTDAVVVVPGFFASTLGDTRRGGLGLIWFDAAGLFRSNKFGALRLGKYDGLESDLNPDVKVVSTGAIPLIYDVLRLALEARRYTTAVYGIDWRKDLEIAAKGLHDRLVELGEGESPRPVHLVAHSQGAMVARRALQLLGAAQARRIVKHLVLLGPANAGSFSAALALSGDHESIPMLRKLAFEPADGFRSVFATMSGLYQLMPWDESRIPSLSDPAHAIGRAEFWKGKTPVDETRLAKFYGWAKEIDTAFFNDRTSVILGDYFGQKTPRASRSARTGSSSSPSSSTATAPSPTAMPSCRARPPILPRGRIIPCCRPIARSSMPSEPSSTIPCPTSHAFPRIRRRRNIIAEKGEPHDRFTVPRNALSCD